MKIIIYTNEEVPIGMAATNRIFSYAKGLVELGNKVTVYSSKPGLNSKYVNIKEKFEDVDYEILSKASTWNVSRLIKILFIIRAHFKLIKVLSQSKKSEVDTIMILVSNKAYTIIWLRLLTKYYGIPLIQEKSEFPFNYLSTSWFRRNILAKIYCWIVYKMFDGMIVMTKPLKDFYTKKVRKTIPILIYPLTLDVQRFIDAIPCKKYHFKYIGYCGYLGGNKDGIPTLIRSFAMVIHKIPDIKLVLAGDAKRNELNSLNALVNELDINQKVIFTGKIDRNDVPAFLKGAEVLILTRPDNMQAAGGFPTKLGEYMSSGRPVIVTRVGEIHKYLIDKYHVMFCEPDNTADIATKLIAILSNMSTYEAMGRNGQQFAKENMDYFIKSTELEEFLRMLLYERHNKNIISR